MIIINDEFNKIVFSNQKAWDILGDDSQNPYFFKKIYEDFEEEVKYNQFLSVKQMKIDGKFFNIKLTKFEGNVSHYIFLIEEIKEEL